MNPELCFRYLMGSFGAVCSAIFFLQAHRAWREEHAKREVQRYSCIRDHECDRRFQNQPMQPDLIRRARGSAAVGLTVAVGLALLFWVPLALEFHRLHADWATGLLFVATSAAARVVLELGEGANHAG